MRAVRHVGIVVADLARARRFYEGLLGLRETRTLEESGPYLDSVLGLTGARVTTVKLAADEGPTLVELLRFTSHTEPDPRPRSAYAIGPTHVAFTVSDLDAAYRQLVDAGIAFTAPPQDAPDGRARVAFCYDPDGTLIELVEAHSDPRPY
jgi:catechol 2,3-dioxygenase-like lactoylglutathione lyase family enzyme